MAGEPLAFPRLSRSVAGASVPKMILAGREIPWGHQPAQLLGTEPAAYKQMTGLKFKDIFKAYPK